MPAKYASCLREIDEKRNKINNKDGAFTSDQLANLRELSQQQAGLLAEIAATPITDLEEAVDQQKVALLALDPEDETSAPVRAILQNVLHFLERT